MLKYCPALSPHFFTDPKVKVLNPLTQDRRSQKASVYCLLPTTNAFRNIYSLVLQNIYKNISVSEQRYSHLPEIIGTVPAKSPGGLVLSSYCVSLQRMHGHSVRAGIN